MKDTFKLLHGGDIVYKEAKKRPATATATEEDGEEDALSWVMKMKRSESKKETNKEKTREENGTSKKIKQATADGLFVSHGYDEFQAGTSEILVLKDTFVLADENDATGSMGETAMDELVSTQMVEKKTLEKNLKNKQLAKGYKGYDEYTETGNDKRGLLYQYDQDDDDNATTTTAAAADSKASSIASRQSQGKGFVVGQKLSSIKKSTTTSTQTTNLLANDHQAASQTMKDFYTSEEMRHVPRAPVLRNLRKRELDPVIDAAPIQSTASSDAFIDEEQEELQKALEKARRAAIAKAKVKHEAPSVLPGKLREQSHAEPATRDDASGLVISEVTEFVNRVMTTASLVKKSETAKQQASSAGIESLSNPLSHDQDMREEELSMAASEKQGDAKTGDTTAQEFVIRDEPLVSQGIGATLLLLRRKGTLSTPTTEQRQESETFSHRQKWLAEQAVLESVYDAQVKKDKALVRGSNMTKSGSAAKREREEAEKKAAKLIAEREKERQKVIEERFKDYKPQAKLEYFDDSGRALDPKDAFRQLSHKFHGMSSGKNKTEKKLKKIENELLMQKMSASDTPLHTASALLEKQKSLGTAHVVLSSGSRNSTADMYPTSLIESRATTTAAAAAFSTSSSFAHAHAHATPSGGGARSMQSVASQEGKNSTLSSMQVDSPLSSSSPSVPSAISKPKIFGMVKKP